MQRNFFERLDIKKELKLSTANLEDMADYLFVRIDPYAIENKSLRRTLRVLDNIFIRNYELSEFAHVLKGEKDVFMVFFYTNPVEMKYHWAFMLLFRQILEISGDDQKDLLKNFYPHPKRGLILPDIHFQGPEFIVVSDQYQHFIKEDTERIIVDRSSKSEICIQKTCETILPLADTFFVKKVKELSICGQYFDALPEKVVRRLEEAINREKKPLLKNIKFHCPAIRRLFEMNRRQTHNERFAMGSLAAHCDDGPRELESLIKKSPHWQYHPTEKQMQHIKKKPYYPCSCALLQFNGICKKGQDPKFGSFCFRRKTKRVDSRRGPSPFRFGTIAPDAYRGLDDF